MHSVLSRFIASSVCSRYIEGVRCRLLANTGEVDRPPAIVIAGRKLLARSSSSPILIDLYGASLLSVVTIEGDVAVGVVRVVGWIGHGGSTRLHSIDGDAH